MEGRCLFNNLEVESVSRTGWNGSGEYVLQVSRKNAELKDLEAMDWAHPTIVNNPARCLETRLPENVGFELDHVYFSGSRWEVHLKVLDTYYGDTTPYLEKIREMEEENTALRTSNTDLQTTLEAIADAYAQGVDSNG